MVEADEDTRPRVFEVPGSIHGVRQAGDTIDNFLRAAILKKHDIDLEGDYGRRIGGDLNLRIRQFKETLFRDSVLRYQLEDDTSGEYSLDEFLKREDVGRFASLLDQQFQKVFDSVDPSWIENLFSKQGVMVVLTGGGARLPMVRHLAEGVLESRKLNVVRRPAPLIPNWISEGYKELETEYPQLAVAIGGAAPTLPEMGPQVARFGGGLIHTTYKAGNLQLKGL